MAYVNHSGVGDIVAQLMDAIDSEPTPTSRMKLIHTLNTTLGQRLTDTCARLAYELKTQGMSTAEIGTELGLSGRHIIRLIRSYSRYNNIRNPLDKVDTGHAIDIRHLVAE